MHNMRTPPDFDLDVVLSYLPKDFFKSPPGTASTEDSSTNIDKVAFIMALFGWQGHTHERLGVQLGSVSCQACFRVLGLWLFKSKEVNENGEEVVGAAVNCLDVVKEHREYCPWRNPASQNGQKATAKAGNNALAGWQIVRRVLKNDHHLRMSGERQGTSRTARPITPDSGDQIIIEPDVADEDAERVREENDKKRWARLRRVKSLFDTKGGKKLNRADTTKSKPRT
jgi:hypothetical protein